MRAPHCVGCRPAGGFRGGPRLLRSVPTFEHSVKTVCPQRSRSTIHGSGRGRGTSLVPREASQWPSISRPTSWRSRRLAFRAAGGGRRGCAGPGRRVMPSSARRRFSPLLAAPPAVGRRPSAARNRHAKNASLARSSQPCRARTRRPLQRSYPRSCHVPRENRRPCPPAPPPAARSPSGPRSPPWRRGTWMTHRRTSGCPTSAAPRAQAAARGWLGAWGFCWPTGAAPALLIAAWPCASEPPSGGLARRLPPPQARSRRAPRPAPRARRPSNPQPPSPSARKGVSPTSPAPSRRCAASACCRGGWTPTSGSPTPSSPPSAKCGATPTR